MFSREPVRVVLYGLAVVQAVLMNAGALYAAVMGVELDPVRAAAFDSLTNVVPAILTAWGADFIRGHVSPVPKATRS